jgi:hypothetical protein
MHLPVDSRLQRLGVMQTPRKLKLNKETILELNTNEVEAVNSGILVPTTTVQYTLPFTQ